MCYRIKFQVGTYKPEKLNLIFLNVAFNQNLKSNIVHPKCEVVLLLDPNIMHKGI